MTELETELATRLEDKLTAMMARFDRGEYHGKCELAHLAEMVKLAHQIRSLKTPEI